MSQVIPTLKQQLGYGRPRAGCKIFMVRPKIRRATRATQLYRQGDDGSEAIARLVQENPLASLLIAGGIGFVLAALLMRSPSPRRRRWRYYA
jgi:ElaB/YqjD/DUF883 family membrane-anchored ribosome-binding protein